MIAVISDMINKMKKMVVFHLILVTIIASEVLTIIIVSAMSVLFHGKITYDYLMTGAIAAFFASFIVGGALVFLVKQLQSAHKTLNGEMSRRIKYEEEQIKSRNIESIVRLTAGIAHEINNPLSTASLNLQVLKNKLQDSLVYKEFLQKLEIIERNIDRASVIAKELMEFSRQRECQFMSLDINKIMADALEFMEDRFDNIKIYKHLLDSPDITGDPVKLEQVFTNILNNCVESMPQGGDIFISTSFSNNHVVLKISDTGTGISEEDLTKVFTPFFTTKDVGIGTGLGLSICYSIIEQHYGDINISSVPGKGTKVTVKFPVGKQ